MEINFGSKECNVKIVYYGPGLSGKTTNLEIIHQKTPESNRGKLTALATDMDRTLYFDYMPIDLGKINGLTVRLRLFTVPGQVFYNATRKIVLRCVDGVVFVADSQESQRKANIESFENLKENLLEQGLSIEEVPLVLQYNKRDLPNAVPFDVLDADLKFHPKIPSFGAIAPKGDGVFQCLKAIANLTMAKVEENVVSKPRPTGDKESQRVGASLASAKPSDSVLQRKKQEVEITQKRKVSLPPNREDKEERQEGRKIATPMGQDLSPSTTHLGQNKTAETTHFPKVGQTNEPIVRKTASMPSFPASPEPKKFAPSVGEKKPFLHQPFHNKLGPSPARPAETVESKDVAHASMGAKEPLKKNFSGFLEQRKAASAPMGTVAPPGTATSRINKFSMPLFQGSLSSGESLSSSGNKKIPPMRPTKDASPIASWGKIPKKEDEEE